MSEPRDHSHAVERPSRPTAAARAAPMPPVAAVRAAPTPSATMVRGALLPPVALLLAAIAALLAMLCGGAALAQNAPGAARQSIEEASGHVPAFEILERVANDEPEGSIVVDIEPIRIVSPELILVGPNGIVIEETGTSFAFGDLPPGEYLVSVTAERMRQVSGTVGVAAGEEVHVAVRLFNQRRYYADEADTPILGIFKIDVADNVADPRGSIVVNVAPEGKIAMLRSDGFTRVETEPAESWRFDDLEADRYVVALTRAGSEMFLTTVVIEEEELVTLDVVLEDVALEEADQ